MKAGRGLCLLSLIVAAVLTVGPFTATVLGSDVRQGALELNAFGGLYRMEGNQWLADAPVYGGRLGYFISRDVSFEFGVGYCGSKYSIDGSKGTDYATFSVLNGQNVDITHFRGEFLYHFPAAVDRLVPFVAMGSGLLWVNSPAVHDELDTEVTAGLGMKVMLSEDILLRLEARYVCMLDNWIRLTREGGATLYSNGRRWNNLETVFGASYLLGGKAKDSDDDGVTDDQDACPDTPRGVVVDAKGCPIDRDGDGVFDGIDQCPGTPKGAWVDSLGCPRDSDGDGVPDGLDQCPETPFGTPVDAVGCPLKQLILDGDGDGVSDNLDRCPETAPGTVVDAEGCDLLSHKIYFKINSAQLTTRDQAVLDNAAAVLKAKATPATRIQIEGHTDSRGSAVHNQRLSVQRAEAVRAFLVGKGLPAAMFATAGYGPSRPVASNATDEGRARNRRIEFNYLPGKGSQAK